MSVNSIWRALPPSCRKQIGRSVRTGYHNWRASPRHNCLSATSLTTRRQASNATNGTAPDTRSPKVEEGPAPKWGGGTVFGITLGAALLGWGAATVSVSHDGPGPVQLDSKIPFSRYASMKEMEFVRSLNEYFCFGVCFARIKIDNQDVGYSRDPR